MGTPPTVRAAHRAERLARSGLQAVLDRPVELEVDGTPLRFTRADAARVRSRARSASRLHNEARPAAARAVIGLVARKYAGTLGADVLGGANLAGAGDAPALRREVAAEPAVHRLVDRLWPRLTAERLIADLFASPAQLAAATPGWSEAERALLHRRASAPWTPADVPLLEEADELLGVDDSARRAAVRHEQRRRLRHAQETLDLLHGSRSPDSETEDESEELSAGDLLDAEGLAGRHAVTDTRSVAERAAADRTWTYGHVIVDEAQELSAMAWRVLLRRCPTRSMTLVGDVAQTGSAAGASSWAQLLTPHLGQSWRLEQLTVNYRTPAEIMAVAHDVLSAGGTGGTTAQAVRSTGVPPWSQRVDEAGLADAAVEAAAEFDEEGTLAVVVPRSRLAAIADAVRARLPAASTDGELTGPAVLAPEAVKGLEFDSVLVVDPVGIGGGARAQRPLCVPHPGHPATRRRPCR